MTCGTLQYFFIILTCPLYVSISYLFSFQYLLLWFFFWKTIDIPPTELRNETMYESYACVYSSCANFFLKFWFLRYSYVDFTLKFILSLNMYKCEIMWVSQLQFLFNVMKVYQFIYELIVCVHIYVFLVAHTWLRIDYCIINLSDSILNILVVIDVYLMNYYMILIL